MLGSGKTTLTQGLAWGAGVDGYAHSPTFVLVNQYEGRIPVYHADLYRVEGGNLEAHDLGFEEMLDEGVCVVEWPENAPLVFQESHLSITISFGDDPDDRAIKVQAHGERYHRLMEDLWKAVVK
jgi:tRNA threonylcarbamoyladenosine biosynthesis protein TsaE